MATADEDSYPGASIGLPPTGRGSLASWWSRIAALVLDWGACMVVAVFLFGVGVLREGGWRAWMILAVYFVEASRPDHPFLAFLADFIVSPGFP